MIPDKANSGVSKSHLFPNGKKLSESDRIEQNIPERECMTWLTWLLWFLGFEPVPTVGRVVGGGKTFVVGCEPIIPDPGPHDRNPSGTEIEIKVLMADPVSVAREVRKALEETDDIRHEDVTVYMGDFHEFHHKRITEDLFGLYKEIKETREV